MPLRALVQFPVLLTPVCTPLGTIRAHPIQCRHSQDLLTAYLRTHSYSSKANNNSSSKISAEKAITFLPTPPPLLGATRTQGDGLYPPALYGLTWAFNGYPETFHPLPLHLCTFIPTLTYVILPPTRIGPLSETPGPLGSR